MNKRKILIVSLPLLLSSTIIRAEERVETGTVDRTRMQNCMPSMSVDECALYQNINAGGEDKMNRNGQANNKGSSGKRRDGESNNRGYGSGYSSRRGAGQERQ